MEFGELIRCVEKEPLRYLDGECALSLDAFLVGYKCANAAARPLLLALRERIPGGPREAGACISAYLHYGGGPVALHHIFRDLREMTTGVVLEPARGPDFGTPYVEVVREAIATGRTGMVLAEPTVTWLADHYNGFIAGELSVDRSIGEPAAERLRRFERWLRDYYGQPNARWYGLIRVFEGAGSRGLTRFVELWDEFEAANPITEPR